MTSVPILLPAQINDVIRLTNKRYHTSFNHEALKMIKTAIGLDQYKPKGKKEEEVWLGLQCSVLLEVEKWETSCRTPSKGGFVVFREMPTQGKHELKVMETQNASKNNKWTTVKIPQDVLAQVKTIGRKHKKSLRRATYELIIVGSLIKAISASLLFNDEAKTVLFTGAFEYADAEKEAKYKDVTGRVFYDFFNYIDCRSNPWKVKNMEKIKLGIK